MKGTMKVAVMNGIGKMGYTTRPIPTPKEDEVLDRKSTRLNSSHIEESRMPSSA